MRIFLLSHHIRDKNGGAAGADLRLAAALKSHNCEVDSFFYDDVLPSFLKGTFRQLVFPWFAAYQFFKKHLKERYDVIESTAGDWYVAYYLMKLLGMRLPLISVRTHGLEHLRAELDEIKHLNVGKKLRTITRLYHYKYRLWEVRTDLKHAEWIFFLNEDDRKYATEKLRIDQRKIYVMPNGLPDYFFLESVPRIEAEKLFKLLFLGSWVEEKGKECLVRAVEQLFEKSEKYNLTCAGVKISEENVLSEFKPSFRSRVHVVRNYENTSLPGILHQHGVLLHPSYAEGCSLSILEALSAGLVVISTPVGNSKELIVDGMNGFLIAHNDIQGFVQTVLSLPYIDFHKISEEGRKSVRDFTWTSRATSRIRLWISPRKPCDTNVNKSPNTGSDSLKVV